MAMAGKLANLRIFSHVAIPCEGPVPTPASVTVEISDPDNLPVGHQSFLNTSPKASAIVEFTPTKAGRHHILAAFEPVGGIHQLELQVVGDRSAKATRLEYGKTCNALERTCLGAWVCDSNVTREGAVLKSFPNGRLAVAGDVVWVVEPLQIQRYVDTGVALELTATLAHFHGAAEFLLASEEELVVLHSAVLQRISFSGAGLSSTGPTGWEKRESPFTQDGPPGLLIRSGDRLGVVTRFTPSPGTPPVNQVCPYRLEGGHFVRTSEPCQQFSGTIVGFEPQGLWVGDPRFVFIEGEFVGLKWMEWTATGLVEQASLSLNSDLELIDLPVRQRLSVAPVLSHKFALGNGSLIAVATYAPERHTILLEHLGGEVLEPLVSTSLLWGVPVTGSPATGISVRLRPPRD
ncbi:hypothetical protein [Hyalangium rubrum]|uniref:Lipoprotein n=1 Tax=Hyalangium rubrum TaxID=3103134 RepID=A0ABU5HHP5_9BACT|nr:hypothetical protein [Hyalangium sp. s54d21]MDY7231595.1 hypothetical protein [Hyalangium sp. s54d21]